MITIKKCDEGVPLPEGSSGTFYTWDTWDETEGKSITRHRRKSEARAAADRMNADPTLRTRITALLARVRGSHDLDTMALSAMVGVEWLSDEDPSLFDRDGNDKSGASEES